MTIGYNNLEGNIDIIFNETGPEILIHGDPQGLLSLANLLTEIANKNQKEIKELPDGAREHVHLNPGIDISKSSTTVIIGRLDSKGTGAFYKSFIKK